MFAGELISPELFPLKKKDTAESAILLMQEWKVYELPVADGGKVVGFCALSDLLLRPKSESIVQSIRQNKAYLVNKNLHLFEVIRFFTEHDISVAAVVEADNFIGLVSARDLLKAYRQSALSQPGGIIELQMPASNYSLAEIAHLVESNDVKILHLYIKALTDETGHIEVSMKLNTTDLKNVLTTLDRYQYQVTGVYQATEVEDNFQSRYNNLIKYLNT